MLSNAKVKYIKSLQIKKYRQIHRSFIVEGAKNMLELLDSGYDVELAVVTSDFHDQYKRRLGGVEVIVEKQSAIESAGTLKANSAGLMVAKIRENDPFMLGKKETVLVLEDIRDPGNLGTILRTADWFGIAQVVASEETAELYNPKVVQASMGSFTRVKVYYEDLPLFFEKHPDLEVAGAFLEGEPVYDFQFALPLAVVLGNESRGISPQLEKYIRRKITIPRLGRAESLNVALSTAVICDNLARLCRGRA